MVSGSLHFLRDLRSPNHNNPVSDIAGYNCRSSLLPGTLFSSSICRQHHALKIIIRQIPGMNIRFNKSMILVGISCFLLGIIVMGIIFCYFLSPSRETIHTDRAPKPIGPYSQAIQGGGLVFTSGQIGIDPLTGNVSADMGEQTEQIMKNLQEILSASGSDFSDVVSTRIYLTNISDFSTVNEIYSRYMERSAPARSTIGVSGLPKGARIEIEMIAVHS